MSADFTDLMRVPADAPAAPPANPGLDNFLNSMLGNSSRGGAGSAVTTDQHAARGVENSAGNSAAGFSNSQGNLDDLKATIARLGPTIDTPEGQQQLMTALQRYLNAGGRQLRITDGNAQDQAAALQSLLNQLQNGDQNHPKWTDKKLFPTTPSAADIKQSGIGDCYLAATMGAVAHANPQWIKDRIHYDDHTSNFDVTLWNGHEWQHISVTQSDIQTNRDHHGASWPDPGAPVWPSVLESAYAKMHSPSDELGYALDHGIGQGGHAHDAMQALTGNRGMTINPEHVWFTRESIDQEITTALANHQPVTISSSSQGHPMVSNHTYIVERIDGTGSDAYLILRNPWESNPNDPTNSMSAVRLGDVVGSGLTGVLDGYGTHPTSEINIGDLGR